VVVFSSAAKNWLVNVEGIDASHITVINQGFDFSTLNPSFGAIENAKHDLGFKEDDINIVCVARYSKVKGQDYLVKAFSDLSRLLPNISLTFIGPGDAGWLIDQVDRLGLSDSVRILPERADIPACIAAADFVVHPSLADSFSQLLIEAQAVGGVLIATDIAAAQEQIADGITGLIVPPHDSIAIVNALISLIGDPNRALTIRQQAAIHVRNKFTLERMYEESVTCLELFSKEARSV
jgi:glycosyltransferase involved in cell wall biosynthesis